MPPEPLWTVAEVARHLGVTDRTIRSWMVARRLPYLKIGGTVRFQQTQVAEWAGQFEEPAEDLLKCDRLHTVLPVRRG
jgi:excisionase family DNA binding protein